MTAAPGHTLVGLLIRNESLNPWALNADAERLIMSFLTTNHGTGFAGESTVNALVLAVMTEFRTTPENELADLGRLYGVSVPAGHTPVTHPPYPDEEALEANARQADMRYAPHMVNSFRVTATLNVIAAADDGSGTLFVLLEQEWMSALDLPERPLGDLIDAYVAATMGPAAG